MLRKASQTQTQTEEERRSTQYQIIQIKNDLKSMEYLERQLLMKGYTLQDLENEDYFDLMKILSAKKPDDTVVHTGDDALLMLGGGAHLS